jgi:hypothetical protein
MTLQTVKQTALFAFVAVVAIAHVLLTVILKGGLQ